MFNGLTSKGIPPLDFLSSMKSLEKLDISSNEYVFYIRPATVLPHLKHLDISGCENIHDLETIRDLKNLKKLDIRGITGPGELSKEEQEAIASLPLLKTLIASKPFDIQTNIKYFEIR